MVTVTVIVATSVPTIAVLGAFWKLSSRLGYQDAVLKSLSERMGRVERIIDGWMAPSRDTRRR